jgi:hypothetical protein
MTDTLRILAEIDRQALVQTQDDMGDIETTLRAYHLHVSLVSGKLIVGARYQTDLRAGFLLMQDLLTERRAFIPLDKIEMIQVEWCE